MTPPFSRRFMLGAVSLAALPATVSLASSPALAGETEVETAYREFCRLDEIECDLWQAARAIERANPDPELPKYVPFDAHLRPPGPRHEPVTMTVSEENIERLRGILADRAPPAYDRVFGPSYERVQEALDLSVAWMAERDRRHAACGLTVAKEKAAAAREALDTQRVVLFATPARTMRDLALKARAIREHDWGDDDAADDILDEMAAFGDRSEAGSDGSA